MGKRVIFIAITGFCAWVVINDCHAARSKIAPGWSSKAALIQRDSNAFLNSAHVIRNTSAPEDFFAAQDDKKLCELRQSFEISHDRFEQRRNYGLTKVQDEAIRHEEMSNLSQGAFKKFAQTYSKIITDRMKDFTETSAPMAREPVAVAVLAATVYSGRTFKFRVAGLKTETRVDGKEKQGAFSMLLPGVKPEVKYENQVVSGALRAAVAPNVEAVVDSANKGSVSVNYGVSF